ncbi:MAG: dTDP-4-dehydrorhamnose 3,5-epimerase [Promethearchaeota archaeon]
MKKIPTAFPDVWILDPDIFRDSRGYFYESYSYKKLQALGFEIQFVQDNHSLSVQNTIRALHFQTGRGQIKLVHCTKGIIWDVVVDIRPESPTFRQWHGIELSEANFRQILIPVGYAHGYSVLSEVAEVQYKVSNYYDPVVEKGVQWNDKQLKIDWKVKNPILSQKDQSNPSLDEFLSKNELNW